MIKNYYKIIIWKVGFIMSRLKSSDLDFSLSGFRIAQTQRPYNEHRLLVYNNASKKTQHIMFEDILSVFNKDDLLVFNNSKVIPVSIFLDPEHFILFIEPFKTSLTDVRVICPFKPKVGEIFEVNGSNIELTFHEPGWDVYHATITSINNKHANLTEFLDDYAKLPMPIYLKRIPTAEDQIALQNVYASSPGSIATPVAGLHFSKELLSNLKSQGIHMAEVTLHVGYGTFRSFKTEYIDDHKMDKEFYTVNKEAFEEIKLAKDRGSRIIAVGTTSARVLESIAARDDIETYYTNGLQMTGDTSIFIYPPYQFKLTDGLITNFQYPRLPVLAMAAAITGLETLKGIYDESLREDYMYYTFGDAMLLLKR